MTQSTKLKIRHTPQTEYHTCGYCAANSVYRYYGMDPDELQIRDYLGTDHILPYNFPGRKTVERWLGGADNLFSGTSPMDMLAVLYWDGLDTQMLTGEYRAYRDRLTTCLANGDPAIGLMYSCYHWVVISGINSKGVWVVDGMFVAQDIVGGKSRAHTYHVPHDQFGLECHGLLLLSREGERPMYNTDFAREYARGVGFCARILGSKIPQAIRRLLPPIRVE